jgi:hypothetical protein
LRNYDNQVYWKDLRRGPVARFLESLIAETYPDELEKVAKGAARVAAIDKTRWLAQQIKNTEQELVMAVTRITAEQPRGEIQNWLEMLQDLLRKKRNVTLMMPHLPLQDRMQLELMALRNHLYLLIQNYGLRILLLENPSLPAWHVVIDPEGEQCRAIQFENNNFDLNASAGAMGMITTINRVIVQEIKKMMTTLPGRVILADQLAPPSNIVVKHIKNGEKVTERELFGDVFRRPLTSLQINDRYLFSDHHEERLRAYFQIIKNPENKRTHVRVDTLRVDALLQHYPRHYQTITEQQQMFNRLTKAFPNLMIRANLAERLPHDRYLLLTREDGSQARIGIGVGLDFIRWTGETRATDIIIEDPYSTNV